MPRRRKRRTLKPRTPARVRKKKARKTRGHEHPELIGLGLLAVGTFCFVVLYLGWSGGLIGSKAVDGLDGLIGTARYVLPVALLAGGALMVARSELLDVRPFRTGLAVFSLGLMLTLGRAHGGLVGHALDSTVGMALGATGMAIVGVTL